MRENTRNFQDGFTLNGFEEQSCGSSILRPTGAWTPELVLAAAMPHDRRLPGLCGSSRQGRCVAMLHAWRQPALSLRL